MCSSTGDIDADSKAAHGLYFHDTRFLRRMTLTINGAPLAARSVRIRSGRRSRYELVNRPLIADGKLVAEGTVRITRTQTLGHDLRETLHIQNCGDASLAIRLDTHFAARFEHLFDVRSNVPQAGVQRNSAGNGLLAFTYQGIDGRRRNTTISVSPLPELSDPETASFLLELAPREVRRIRIRTILSDLGSGDLEVIPPAPHAVPTVRGTVVETDNADFNRVIDRAFNDLQMLATRQQGQNFFAAGVPWFVALFGRDSLITALEMLGYQPQFAADSLRLLARYQGMQCDSWRDEEPGKIPHELRTGEKAINGNVPHSRYYGTVDATPLFVILLGAYLQWTNDRALWWELRDNVRRALDWMDAADHDGDGFVDYMCRSPEGLSNQGWKDSWNGIRHRDGSIAVPPIGLVEVQAYVYAARRIAAKLLRAEGDAARAYRLERQAADLRRRFHAAFWLGPRSTFAVALDNGGRPVESRTSNPGHALWCGIVDRAPAGRLAKTLMSDRMFSGWGIRTLAADELAYDPDDYQVGAVWPHDNAIVHAGLKRYGFETEAERLFTAIFEAALAQPDARLPELFAGHSRAEQPTPLPYPDACVPQAWAAGALPFMLQTMLGLHPDAPRQELHLIRPRLPRWLHSVVLRDLRIGSAVADLRFVRHANATRVAILRQEGPLHIRIFPGR